MTEPLAFLLALTVTVTASGPGAGSESTPTADKPFVMVVVGAPGEAEYATAFREAAGRWSEAAKKADASLLTVGLDPAEPSADRDRIKSSLDSLNAPSTEPLWLVLLGHGTYDGREAKFNLRGPDVTEKELAAWLAPVKRPVLVLNGASSSGPFLSALSGPGRVVITATRSGHEQNYARFGPFLAGSVADPAADLDKDGQVSVLEAFLTASHRTAEFYTTKSRLATEHPLLDDNGDGKGTPPDWFRGVRAEREANDGTSSDGLRAHQIHLVLSAREKAIPAETRRERDRLELAVAALRDRKAKVAEAEYYRELEALMLALARIYQGLPAPGR